MLPHDPDHPETGREPGYDLATQPVVSSRRRRRVPVMALAIALVAVLAGVPGCSPRLWPSV